MMKVIITKERFDELFAKALDRLELRMMLGLCAMTGNETPQEAIKTLHSKFSYEVSQLKVELEQC